jgi:hypothetical protein
MEPKTSLGRSNLRVPRLGVGAMTWGEPTGLARLSPAKLAYGGAHGREEEQRVFEVSMAAGVRLFDTAAMYSGGTSERRLPLQRRVGRALEERANLKLEPWHAGQGELLVRAVDDRLRVGITGELIERQATGRRVDLDILRHAAAGIRRPLLRHLLGAVAG